MANKIDENKILFVSKDSISTHWPEELHGQNLNNWNGYWCSAGIRSLYIQHDGMVYRATCELDGVQESIYNISFNSVKLTDWIQCTRDVCACGSDMQTPKVKNFEDTHIVSQDEIKDIDYNNLKLIDHVENPDVIFCGAFKQYKMVIWELGRRCNYNCWYCTESSHNGYEAHKTLGTLQYGLKNLTKHWSKGQVMKFVFTGGEPTFNPDYLDFVIELKELGHIIHTTTNGSHTEDYYSRLMQVSDIGFSAHLTYLENPKMYDKFISNIAAAHESKKSDETANLNWLGVRIMLQPGKLSLAKKLYKDCKSIIDNVVIDLLHGHEGTKTIISYSEDELAWAKEKNNDL